MKMTAIAILCTFGGALLGALMMACGASAKIADANDTNGRLSKALKEAAMHLRMAGLNTAADLAMQALDEPKENFRPQQIVGE